MTPVPTRERILRQLDDEAVDVLVVGGGATGAGIARDAVLRGFRVALVEAGDFAGETSSHSSKLIHGGLRYLQYGDFPLVFEALSERRRLMAAAPHLCRPIDFLFPAYQGLPPRLDTLGAGVALYNALALWRHPVGGRRLSRTDVMAISPLLRTSGLQGAQLYVDCQTDDARLVLETVLDAAAAGALVAPRVAVTGLVRDRRGRARGALARDRLTNASVTIRARVIVNATGPFSDSFDRGRHNLRPTLGVHVVFGADRLPHGGRVTVLRSPRDGRLVFVLPAEHRTIVGTTDTDWNPPGSAARAPLPGDTIAAGAADVEYLLDVVNAGFPSIALQPADVVSTFAGLRPLVATEADTPSSTSREHEILIEADGLLTIVGGKLTTYRRMAEEVVDTVVELARDRGFEGPLARCSTARRPLPGGWGDATQPVALGQVELAPDVERHLRQTYGSRAGRVVACMSDSWPESPSFPHASEPPLPDPSSRIDSELPYLWAEVLHSSQEELVSEVEDVLRRRIPVFRDARDQGLGVAAQAAAAIGRVQGWPASRQARSAAAYVESVALSRAWLRERAS